LHNVFTQVIPVHRTCSRRRSITKHKWTNKSIFCSGCGNSRATLEQCLVPLSSDILKAWLDTALAGLV